MKRLKTDTILHFLASGIIAYLLATPYMIYREPVYLWLSAYAVVVIGLVKEFADWVIYGRDMGLRKFLPLAIKDMAVNCAGIAVAILLAVFYG